MTLPPVTEDREIERKLVDRIEVKELGDDTHVEEEEEEVDERVRIRGWSVSVSS